MKIEHITIPHPKLHNRNITLILVDAKLDIPSAKFLIYESHYGGRCSSIAGKSTHYNKAIKIIELYRHLEDIGLTWDKAIEEDIKLIRNAMLCWDDNGNEDYCNFEYEPIENDTMNGKLGTWFKFYKYMKSNNYLSNMILTTKKIRKRNIGMLSHLNKRNNGLLEYVEVWSLRVKPSPKSLTYHALTRTEFSHLLNHLEKIDIAYAMVALLMVETGLRVSAALSINAAQLKGFFRILGAGKNINDVVPLSYLAKASEDTRMYCDLPLRTILVIQKKYLSRIYIQRKNRHEVKADNTSCKYIENTLWLLENGKEVKYHDVLSAFRKASIKMGYNQKKITPHWMRHTFATWSLIDFSKNEKISLSNTGATPNALFMLLLSEKMGHSSIESTMKYIATALKLMGVGLNKGPIIISLTSFKKDIEAQNLIKFEAKNEFGEKFKEEKFDVYKYALSRKIVVED